MTANPTLSTTASAFGSFFSTIGRGFSRAATQTHAAVDPDARRDLAWMPVVAMASIGRQQVPVRALPDDGHRPIVFVHGLAGYRGNFTPMRAWLRLHDRRRTYAIGLTGSSIPEKSRELQRYIARVAEVNDLADDAQIDLVAHSMGGLVCRLALHEVQTARRVHTLLTLATPHGGTHAARFAGGPLTGSLRRDSDLMAQLDADQPWRSGTRLVCFWSNGDPLMQPAKTATMAGAENREVSGFSHLDWLMRKRAWMDVDSALRDG